MKIRSKRWWDLRSTDDFKNLIASSSYKPQFLQKITSQSVYNLLRNPDNKHTDKSTPTKNITSAKLCFGGGNNNEINNGCSLPNTHGCLQKKDGMQVSRILIWSQCYPEDVSIIVIIIITAIAEAASCKQATTQAELKRPPGRLLSRRGW